MPNNNSNKTSHLPNKDTKYGSSHFYVNRLITVFLTKQLILDLQYTKHTDERYAATISWTRACDSSSKYTTNCSLLSGWPLFLKTNIQGLIQDYKEPL